VAQNAIALTRLAHFQKPGIKWSKAEGYQHYMNVIRKEFEWYNEVSSRVTRNAIDDLDNAFKHFFRRVKAKQKAGFPRFKKKDLRDSFALRESVKFDVIGRELRLEKLKTKIELRQSLRFQGTAKQVTMTNARANTSPRFWWIRTITTPATLTAKNRLAWILVSKNWRF